MAENSAETRRRGTGKPFPKGKSPNPGGRPKLAPEFRARCRVAVDKTVIEKWISEVESLGENWLKASELLAAYGYGRPTQGVELNGGDGKALSFTIIRQVAK